MFTGLITDIGTITSAERGGARIAVECAYPADDIALGESIAVNGCCLTVVEIRPVPRGALLGFDLSPETLARTRPGLWKAGEKVNLERALRVGDRMGGHFVTGHVDGLAKVISVTPEVNGNLLISLETAENLKKFVATKCSVALDGVSLTVNSVEDARFSVNIIPHTLAHTTLGERKPGDALHLEVDLIARYVERMLP